MDKYAYMPWPSLYHRMLLYFSLIIFLPAKQYGSWVINLPKKKKNNCHFVYGEIDSLQDSNEK